MFFQPLLPELELAQGDRHPDEDHRQAGDGNQDQVDRVSRVDTGQKGEDPTQHAYQQGDGRNPSFVGFGKNNWNLAQMDACRHPKADTRRLNGQYLIYLCIPKEVGKLFAYGVHQSCIHLMIDK